MVDVSMEKKEEIAVQNPGSLKNISITMCGTDKKIMNRTAKEFYDFVTEYDSACEMPVILPVQEACFTTRKSPCGNGTATFSRVKLRIFQRLFKLSVYDKDVTAIVEFLKNSPVDVQFKIEQ